MQDTFFEKVKYRPPCNVHSVKRYSTDLYARYILFRVLYRPPCKVHSVKGTGHFVQGTELSVQVMASRRSPENSVKDIEHSVNQSIPIKFIFVFDKLAKVIYTTMTNALISPVMLLRLF